MAAPPAAERVVLLVADRVHTFAAPPPGHTRTAATVQALLLRDGRVVAAGTAHQLQHLAPRAPRLDLRGSTITPGLTDAHAHLVEWSLARREADLSTATTPEAAAQTVARHARARAGEWVRGRGWNPHHWDALPHRSLLDAAVPDRPVALQSHDMHALWVNSQALERAGIGAGSPDPEGGRILRDEDGRPAGVLLENATQLVLQCLPPPSEQEAAGALLEGQLELHRLGITGIHSVEADSLRIFESVRARGRLRLRVLQHLPLARLDDAIRLGLRSALGGEWIRIGGVKMFLDGALGSRTAWLSAPYQGSSDCGVQVLPEPEFRDAVERAARAGLASTVHAIGDAAVGLALDVLALPQHRTDTLPHRIEHLQLCPPERLADAGRAGIVCSMQPAHLITDWRPAELYWGHERSRTAYAFRSLLRGGLTAALYGTAVAPPAGSGAVLAFGSDMPVEPPDPRLGLFAATARSDLAGEPRGGWFPEERLTTAEALRAYTLGPAHAAGLAGSQGQLTPGAFADLVAWDRDPLALSGADLLEVHVVATMVAGELV
ncbi:MAG: amidohydrolase [Gemmatimonadetes bacterium]|nr:amidohydrolase [Gemmatimonadota bacterium]